ncbi:MAG: hypothetical protein GY799_09960 [Desulfobulbaceae bacterium]|nr:hypothetical protein [Desulfobulbaceae bacterium]
MSSSSSEEEEEEEDYDEASYQEITRAHEAGLYLWEAHDAGLYLWESLEVGLYLWEAQLPDWARMELNDVYTSD